MCSNIELQNFDMRSNVELQDFNMRSNIELQDLDTRPNIALQDFNTRSNIELQDLDMRSNIEHRNLDTRLTMSREILLCLKCERDKTGKPMFSGAKVAFTCTPALRTYRHVRPGDTLIMTPALTYLPECVLVGQHPVVLGRLLVKKRPLVPGLARKWQVVSTQVCAVKDKPAGCGIVFELAVNRGYACAFVAKNLVVLLSAVMREEVISPPD